MIHDAERVKQATLAWVKGHFEMNKKFPTKEPEAPSKEAQTGGEAPQEAVEKSAGELQGSSEKEPETLQEMDRALQGEPADLILNLMRKVERMFNCSDGEPRAVSVHPKFEGKGPYPYEVCSFSAKKGGERELQQVVLFAFEALQEDGATFILWRRRPVFEYHGSQVRLYCRLAAIKDNGEQAHLRGEYLQPEGEPSRQLADTVSIDDAPETPPSVAEEIATGPAPLGYDLVEVKEDAVLHCAWLIHSAVKALNDAHGEHTVDWEKNKVSVMAGVNRMLENPDETPEQNHAAWMKFKADEGWVYGLTKDAEAKTHPCLVPYEALPPVQKAKDLIFQAIVRGYFGV